MSRLWERLIDFAATLALLAFAWLMRETQPGLAGMVVGAAVSFWLQKNAMTPGQHAAKALEEQAKAVATKPDDTPR